MAHDDSSSQQPRPAPTEALGLTVSLPPPRCSLFSLSELRGPRRQQQLMPETDGSIVHENIQSTESNEVSDMLPTATEAQSRSKRKRSSRTSLKPPQPRKVTAPRSKVWQDFTRLPEDYNRCKCNYLFQEYSCKSTYRTSSLSNHLKMCLEKVFRI
ncbi:hypothetical protein WN943_004233 [Citrus x changshan-huyou]